MSVDDLFATIKIGYSQPASPTTKDTIGFSITLSENEIKTSMQGIDAKIIRNDDGGIADLTRRIAININNRNYYHAYIESTDHSGIS